MLRSRSSGVGFAAPSFASLLACSFPSTPSWPLTHLKRVGAVRLRSRYAVFLNRGAFLTRIRPCFSHTGRCVVRPSIVYLESDIISRCWDSGTEATTISMAAISSTWFDWTLPGTFIALFRGLFGPAQIPPPQEAFLFPLFRQAPSVYIVIFYRKGCFLAVGGAVLGGSTGARGL